MATQRKSSYLQNVNVLQDLSPDEIDHVGDQTHLLTYPPEHIFYMPEESGEVLFILKKGRVQLYRISPDGRKLVMAVLHPGAIFGHMALVGQRLHDTYAEALDECVICVWNREQVEKTIEQKPQVALRFLEALGERLSQAEEKLTEVTFKRLPARLAKLLLTMSDEQDTCELTGFTHQYLADVLGTYRETVTQILNDFKNKTAIELGRKQIRILNSAILADIASADW